MAAELGLALDRVTFLRGQESERSILDEVSHRFSPSQVTLVTGPTGSGKSTLIHLLGGLIRPTEGVIEADGEPISRWVASHRDRWRRNAGIMLQDAQLISGLSAFENVLVRRLPRCSSLKQLRAEAQQTLQSLNASHLASRPIEELSGGERQRIALARTLLGEPRFLLLDEPSAHQDLEGLKTLLEMLLDAKSRGAVVIVTTHDPRLLEAGVADVTLRLESGRLEESSGS